MPLEGSGRFPCARRAGNHCQAFLADLSTAGSVHSTALSVVCKPHTPVIGKTNHNWKTVVPCMELTGSLHVSGSKLICKNKIKKPHLFIMNSPGFLSVYPWASNLMSLSLSFLICGMGLLISSSFRFLCGRLNDWSQHWVSEMIVIGTLDGYPRTQRCE